MILSNTEWRESQKLITEGKIKILLQWVDTIVDVILIEISKRGDYALLIETEFVEEENKIKGYFMLIPDTGSLEIILQAIGVI